MGYQRVPRLYYYSLSLYIFFVNIEIKYVQEGYVGEHADCHLGYIAPVNSQCRLLCKKVPRTSVLSLMTCLRFGQ